MRILVNCLAPIFTGDNLDQYVRASQLTAESRNKGLHLFTSNLILSRIAIVDMCNEPPKVDIAKLSADSVLLTVLSGNDWSILIVFYWAEFFVQFLHFNIWRSCYQIIFLMNIPGKCQHPQKCFHYPSCSRMKLSMRIV